MMTPHNHNIYPLPKAARKRQPALLGEFGRTVGDFEEQIFKAVSYFSVVRFGVPGGSQVATVTEFPRALALAHGDKRTLIYCVTEAGRAFCMSWRDYGKFAELWLGMASGRRK